MSKQLIAQFIQLKVFAMIYLCHIFSLSNLFCLNVDPFSYFLYLYESFRSMLAELLSLVTYDASLLAQMQSYLATIKLPSILLPLDLSIDSNRHLHLREFLTLDQIRLSLDPDYSDTLHDLICFYLCSDLETSISTTLTSIELLILDLHPFFLMPSQVSPSSLPTRNCQNHLSLTCTSQEYIHSIYLS